MNELPLSICGLILLYGFYRVFFLQPSRNIPRMQDPPPPRSAQYVAELNFQGMSHEGIKIPTHSLPLTMNFDKDNVIGSAYCYLENGKVMTRMTIDPEKIAGIRKMFDAVPSVMSDGISISEPVGLSITATKTPQL